VIEPVALAVVCAEPTERRAERGRRKERERGRRRERERERRGRGRGMGKGGERGQISAW
jgi:hypothetical protein